MIDAWSSRADPGDMSAALFEHRPESCPYGHSLALGRPMKVGWMPCVCAIAQEAAKAGKGFGHLWIWCLVCADQYHRRTMYYEPPHDAGHHPVSPWQSRP
jgi:hypothetical protein